MATVEGLCAICGQRPSATAHDVPEEPDMWPPDPPTGFTFSIPPITGLDGFAYLAESLGRAMRATGEWLISKANEVERKT